MVMEWWTGWFDYWGEEHHDWSPEEFKQELGTILGIVLNITILLNY
jgi:hypothetical protein